MSLERETGIEPATNSLEGCDSTTELLPPSRPMRLAQPSLRLGLPTLDSHSAGLPTGAREASVGWWGGEGSNLRSPKAAGLQPAAIDRSATSPISRSLKDPGLAGARASGCQVFVVVCILESVRPVRT